MPGPRQRLLEESDRKPERVPAAVLRLHERLWGIFASHHLAAVDGVARDDPLLPRAALD